MAPLLAGLLRGFLPSGSFFKPGGNGWAHPVRIARCWFQFIILHLLFGQRFCIFQEKKQLSEEAVKAISETIAEQQKQMETIRQQLDQQRGQDHSFGAETPGMGDDGLIGHQVSLDRKLGLLTSAQQGLTGVNSAINALAEQYPTLYSYASMQHFQQDIFDAEEHLQAARRLYNSNVSLYNQRLHTFPYLLLAKLHGMKEAKFYAVEEKKKDFQVQF